MLNFRLMLTGIDPKPLLRQVYANNLLWQTETEWTAARKQTVLSSAHENIVLRYSKPDPMTPTLNKPAFALLSEAWPIVQRLARIVDHDIIGNVMISRMKPGEVIMPHADITMLEIRPGFRQPVPSRYRRYQIPLYAHPGVNFICGDERLEMAPGEAWWFNGEKTHSVENNSDDVRISMIADISSFAFPLRGTATTNPALKT